MISSDQQAWRTYFLAMYDAAPEENKQRCLRTLRRIIGSHVVHVGDSLPFIASAIGSLMPDTDEYPWIYSVRITGMPVALWYDAVNSRLITYRELGELVL